MMKTLPLKKMIAGALLASSSLLILPLAAANVAVSWGPSPNYVGGHTNGAGLAGGLVPFSDTVARNPGAPYPNGQSSGTYYGGAISDNAGGITVWRISNGASGGNDAISFGSPLNGTPATPERATALYVWKKEDFLSGFNTRTTTITSLTATLQHTGSGSLLTGNARWVVVVDGSYYVSDAFATTTSQAQYTLSALDSVGWFNLIPSTSLSTIGTQWATPDFSNVTGVGLWYQLTGVGSIATAAGSIYQFEAGAIAIPEPAHVALVAGALASGLMLFARRKKQRAFLSCSKK